jgi:mono/diheme cytochrome c family protein
MRNPKSEIRNPNTNRRRSEIQNLMEILRCKYLNAQTRRVIESFRFSDFFRISDFGFRILSLAICLLAIGCQQEMARQPSYRPLERTDFFSDGRASRPLVVGTVPWRGRENPKPSLTVYRRNPDFADAVRAVALISDPATNPLSALPFLTGPSVADYVDVAPIPIDKLALERGRDRFNIYCSVCHDALGTGNGKIVERGYLPPPNYHLDFSRGFERRGQKVRLREAPIGYFYEVITRGFGGMPDYASQVPPEDRWKIAVYVRVLQLSQWMPLKDLPADEREKVRANLTPKEKQP